MPVTWSRAHWLVGLLTLLIFPLTGQYMRHIVAQRVASLLILVAPFFLIAAFFIDPARGLNSSTGFRLGMYSFWIAGILLAIVNRPRRERTPQ